MKELTREEKIRNIITATDKVINEAIEKRTLTTECFEAIVECRNSAIIAIL